jgi:hypothetical protein
LANRLKKPGVAAALTFVDGVTLFAGVSDGDEF